MNPSNTKHGTIRDPQSNTAHESQYNDLYSTSEYCGACHDFVTDKGLELERTYREWRAEGFAATGQTCSDCHMPTYNGQAAVDGPNRTLHRHTFIGADLALVPFPDQANQLNLVTEMLQSALTMTVNAPDTATAGQTYGFTVEILNDKTGHNVPSGVPFNRQMWLSVEVYDANTLIYESGMLDTNGDLMDDFSEFSERDSALYNAQSFMLRADSSITGLTWEAEYFVDNSIRPGQAKQISYAFDIPVTAVQPLKAIVKLRFRSFPPYVFRAIDLDNLNIPIIDMAVDSVSITL